MTLPVYDCPVPDCDKRFDRSQKQGDRCPCGRVKLKYKRYKEGNKFSGKFVVDEETGSQSGSNGLVMTKVSASTGEPSLPLLLTERGEIPAIYLTGPGREDGKHKEYTIEITGMLHNGPVYCPNCLREVTNNSFGSQPIYLDQEAMCSRSNCRAKITILYRANPTLSRY